MDSIIKNTYEFIKTGYANKPKMNKLQLVNRLEQLKKDCIEEIDEFLLALKENDKSEMIDACCDLSTFAANMPIHAQISLEQLQAYGEAVHKSNMTKFCKTYSEASITQEMYANGTHPNKPGKQLDVSIKETGNTEFPYMVVMSNGEKIMKSYKFKDTKEFL